MNEITLATKQSYQSLTKNLLQLYKSSPQNNHKIKLLEKKLSMLIEEYQNINKIVKLADILNQKNTFKNKKNKCLELDLNELNPEIEKHLPNKLNTIKQSKMSVNGVIVQDIKFTSITLEQPDLFETWHISLCSFSKYNHKEGSLTVKFTEEIMPYLAQAKQKFVLYNLKEIANFGSLYTTRLYELIQEFKDTGYLVKSIEQLKTIFVVGSQYSKYNDFKRKTFGHAVNEINSQFDMMLSFEEIKDGRKVVAIKFDFTPTYILRGVDKTGNPKNTYIKPKRKKVIESKMECMQALGMKH